MRSTFAFFILIAALSVQASAATAAPCTAQEFAVAVDQSGASLRNLTLEAQPKLQERLKRYKEALKLTDTNYENAALDAIQDSKLDEFDTKSSQLLLTVDSLGRVPQGAEPDCAKLGELKIAAAQLNTIIKAKSDYMLERLDEKIAEAQRSAPQSNEPRPEAPQHEATAPEAATPEAAAPAAVPKPVPANPPIAKSPAQPPVAMKKPAPKPSAPPAKGWATHTKPDRSAAPPVMAMREPDPIPNLPPPEEEGYTIDEIRDATRGFFGAVSTNLASVIEHAFKQSGRPTAYVLGIEGGGAFLAGLRFGKGTLFMRSQSATREVYWHGPSLGTDFGASGSRTLFLIYRMNSPDDLYRNFTGLDGSAYIVGGFGVTLLKGGQVIMAPIRSGVGVRLGANVGYLRFTQQPTWNPF